MRIQRCHESGLRASCDPTVSLGTGRGAVAAALRSIWMWERSYLPALSWKGLLRAVEEVTAWPDQKAPGAEAAQLVGAANAPREAELWHQEYGGGSE